MGCDIHATIERRVYLDEDRTEHPDWENAGDPLIGRNYELFAVLAGVRNSYGIKPIAEPRGVPDDASTIVDAWKDYWKGDGHNHSWLSLKELKEFEYSKQEIYDYRYIGARNADGKIIRTYGSSGSAEGVERVGKRTVFGLWGPEPFLQLIAKMEKAKEPGDTDDDIRLVFWFDN